MPTSAVSLAIFTVLAILLLGIGFLAVGAWKTKKISAQSTKIVPKVGTSLPVSGGAIHYLDLGPRDCQVLVLIHGLAGQLQHFTYGVTDLLKDDFRLIVLDRPGCGYSERDNESHAGLSEQGAMIWEFLDRLDIARPVLVGHSLGGAIALAMALGRPDRAASLALLAPLTHQPGEPSPVFAGLDIANKSIRSVLASTWAVPAARANAGETLTEVFRPDAWPEDFLDRAGGALGLRPRAFLTNVEDFRASDRTIGPLSARYASELKTPGGVLFGDADALLPADVHGAPMEAFGLSFETLAQHGHMLPITCPSACADFIRRMAVQAQ